MHVLCQVALNACHSSEDVISHCLVFYSPAKSILRGDVCSEHVWLGLPVAKATCLVKRYLKCKSWSPHSASACIAVPAFLSAKWRRLLQGMQLWKQYAKNCMSSAEAGHGSSQVLGPLPWDHKVLLFCCRD